MRDIEFGGWRSPGYGDLIASFETETLLQVDDSDYKSDSRLLLRDGDRYGLLFFGWGSCSGCGALQACDSKAEFVALRDDLREALLRYIQSKDWSLDFSWHQAETRTFLRMAEELLSAPEVFP